MATKVIETNEISLFGVRYPVEGGVKPFLVNQKVAQISTGMGDPTLEEYANTWHVGSLKGGLGRYRIRLGWGDPADRMWDSSIETASDELTLASLATEGLAMGAAVTDIRIGFGGCDYFFAGTVIRRFNGTVFQFYCTDHNTWETCPVTGGHTAQAAPAAVVSSSIYAGRLYMWCTSDYIHYDGTTTWVMSHTPAILGTFATEFDGNLVKITAGGVMTYSTDPEAASPTWTALTTVRSWPIWPSILSPRIRK